MNKVERVARAICEAEGEWPDGVAPTRPASVQRYERWRRYEDCAIAAIKAIEEWEIITEPKRL